uniref:Uncharacterized protein n=1 Tax=Anguilla anguilla TaxID=7936 RepID=A0A0E9UDH7_ANGAN
MSKVLNMCVLYFWRNSILNSSSYFQPVEKVVILLRHE